MLKNLFCSLDVISGVCMSKHVTEILDETVYSIKFNNGYSVKGGSKRKRLSGSKCFFGSHRRLKPLKSCLETKCSKACERRLLTWKSASLSVGSCNACCAHRSWKGFVAVSANKTV